MRKILVVDDEPDIRLVLRVSLRRAGGFEVLEAASGTGALDVARREPLDAILLDVSMPSPDGRATLAALRANPQTAEVPVVFLTAGALAGRDEELRALGAAGVIAKPFDPAQSIAELRRLLGWGEAEKAPGT